MINSVGYGMLTEGEIMFCEGSLTYSVTFHVDSPFNVKLWKPNIWMNMGNHKLSAQSIINRKLQIVRLGLSCPSQRFETNYKYLSCWWVWVFVMLHQRTEIQSPLPYGSRTYQMFVGSYPSLPVDCILVIKSSVVCKFSIFIFAFENHKALDYLYIDLSPWIVSITHSCTATHWHKQHDWAKAECFPTEGYWFSKQMTPWQRHVQSDTLD